VAAHVVALVIVAASAVVSHLATTATNPATLPVNAQNLEPRLATTAARTDTSLASATLLTTVAQAAMETATATATAAANLDTSLVTAPMVGQAVVVTPVIFASATLAVVLVTFLVIAPRAPVVVAVANAPEEMRVMMNTTTDRR